MSQVDMSAPPVPNETNKDAITQLPSEHERPNWAALIVEGIEEVFFTIDTNWRFTFLNSRAAATFGCPKEALVGHVIWEAFPTLIGSNFEQFYRRVMAEGEPGRLEDFSHTTQRWYDVRAYPISQGLIVYFQDITPRKRAEAEIQRQVERARVQAEVSRALAEVTNDYQRTLETAAHHLADIVGDACIIRLLSEDRERFAFVVWHHRDPEAAALLGDLLLRDQNQPATVGVAGHVVQTGQPVLIPIVSSAQVKAMAPSQYGAYLDRFAVTSALMVPLRTTGRVIGAIAMNRLVPSQPYTNDDLTLVQDLADRVAIAITNAQLLQQVQSELAERTRTEAALRVSEERFKVLSGATNEALLIHENHLIIEVNQRALEMFGYSLDEFIGLSIEQLIAPEHLQTLRDRLADNKQQTSEFVGIRKDGSRLITEARGRPIDYQGRRMRLVAIRDITDLKHAKDALRISEARFTGIVASAKDAIISIDESLCIVVFNTAAEQMFRCSTDTMLGQLLDQLLPASVRELHAQHIRRFGQTGIMSRSMGSLGMLTALRSDGEEFPIEATISQTLVAGQRLYTVIIRDITERTQAEETLRNTQAQLLQSQKMESVGLLAGGIAHDFNNLLTVITGYSELILASLHEQDQLYADMVEIQQAGNRAAALTRQLLAFSRQQVLEARVLNLNEVVADMDKLLHRTIGEDIELVSMLDPHLEPVLVDPSQLEQVILNLAINARDAMPDGGQLTIETANVELDEQYRSADHPGVKTGSYVMLAVSDTGTGMDQATQAQIFEPFFTTKEQGKGTGLGLATVYGIVRQSDGYTWVYSEIGVGTTFKIYLPIVQDLTLAQQPTVPIPDHALPGLSWDEPAERTYTIVVAEDDTLVRELVNRVLIEAGYILLSAQNGQEALELLATHPGEVDLVLTDLVMPQMGGRELIDRLRRERASLKVLCMSGYTDQAVIHHGILQLCDAFLQKPFTPKMLLQRLDEVLRRTINQ